MREKIHAVEMSLLKKDVVFLSDICNSYLLSIHDPFPKIAHWGEPTLEEGWEGVERYQGRCDDGIQSQSSKRGIPMGRRREILNIVKQHHSPTINPPTRQQSWSKIGCYRSIMAWKGMPSSMLSAPTSTPPWRGWYWCCPDYLERKMLANPERSSFASL